VLAELELPPVCRPLSLELLYERLITLTLIYLRQSSAFALVSLHPIQTEPRNSMSSFFFMQVALPAKLSVELTDYIMDFLYADVDALRACARVHSSWMPAARKHLYESVHLARPGAWNRLVDVLSQSPEIIPSIKHVTIDGQRQFLQCTMQEFSKLHSLGSLLSNVKSLSLSAVKLHEDPDAVSDFLRTHFLHIRRLRVNAVSAPDCATMQRVLLSPRPTLDALSMSGVSFYCRGGPGLNILAYPELELDRFACTALVEVSERKIGLEIAPASSHIRTLSVHGLQTNCFHSLAALLRNIGPTLEVLKVHMRGLVNQSYPEGKLCALLGITGVLTLLMIQLCLACFSTIRICSA
jgi:hypothetical protein